MKIPLFDIENWKEIGTTLSQNKTRTFLTAFGIFWGTAMLAMLWGGAQGLQSIMHSKLSGFATNSAFLMPDKTSIPYKGFNKGLAWKLTRNDLDNIIDKIPEVETLTALNTRWATTATYGQRHSSVTILGVESYYADINEPLIYEGRFTNIADDVNERKVCVLGKRVATDLFGETSPIGKDIDINGIYFRVIGVCGQLAEVQMSARLDESVTIPHSTMLRAYNIGDNIDAAVILFKRGSTPSSVKPTIERIIRASHPIHPDDRKALQFFDISEIFASIDNLFIGINILAIFVGIGTLLAGIIGVGNIMWVIVKERTQEIGIRRAIGARPRDIIIQILSESIVLTTIAGISGICFATIILGLAEIITSQGIGHPQFQLTFNKAITIMATFMVLGTLAGTIPATKAMHIKPIEAINDK